MLKGKTIAVVIPAYNEETQIEHVLESMPSFVDRMIVVNDCSKDKTSEVVLNYIAQDKIKTMELIPFPNKPVRGRFNEAEMVLQEVNEKEIEHYTPSEIANENPNTDRVILINHLKNGGVGAAIARGYKWCKDYEIACTAVMAGDGQMDPAELEELCLPIIEDNIDYVKGNRLRHPSARLVIPRIRFIGNSILSMLTKIASGYWRISDTQTGYTTISLKALNSINIYDIYKRYGMPNDLLVKLNIEYCTLKEITIKPVYRVGEQSKMNIRKVIRTVSWLLLASFFKRIWQKYFFKDFHPLFLFYNAAFIFGGFSIYYLVKIIQAFINGITMSYEPILAFIFLFTAAFQSFTFAMWMDIQDNEKLYK